jgi:hypothetical protein
VYELLGAPQLAPGRERRLAGYDDPLEPAPEPGAEEGEDLAAPPSLSDEDLEALLAPLI